MSPEELFEKYKHIAKETIFKMYPSPKKIAYHNRIEVEDLIQYASTGLWKACLSYREDKGTKFMTHAINNIRWHVTERLKREVSMIKYNPNAEINPSNMYGIVSFDAPINLSNDEDFNSYHEIVASDVDIENSTMNDFVEEYILSKLNDVQKEILELQEKGLSYNKIGLLWNMTGANVRAKIYKARTQLENYSEVVG